MEILTGVLVVMHLLGWAMALGGVVTRLRKPELNVGVWHGVLAALVTGLLLVGIAEMGDDPVNRAKVAVKLLVALSVAVLVWRGRKRESVTTGYLGGIAALIAVNVSVAVLWH